MEVKSANVTLQLNHATTAVDNSGSDRNNKQMEAKSPLTEAKQDKAEEESVKVYISAAGLRKSQTAEPSEQDLMTEAEVEEMMKKVEGLSSQVVNGHFSIASRMEFQAEIQKLSDEIKKLNGEGISFSKSDNIQLSKRITDLTIKMNEAAMYHRSANAYFIVKNQRTPNRSIRNTLDIAI